MHRIGCATSDGIIASVVSGLSEAAYVQERGRPQDACVDAHQHMSWGCGDGVPACGGSSNGTLDGTNLAPPLTLVEQRVISVTL